ncbi:MAG: pseudouridylate synthase [Cyclobacteriaceae bacterium]
MLPIVYQDQHIIAINKPHGLLVHRSGIANDATEFALQLLRNQINQKVYPAHRLDRKTSGVLIFALTSEADTAMQMLFQERKINKTYLLVARGYTDDEGTIDYPLRRDDGRTQNAITRYKTLDRFEIKVPFGKHSTSRYSLVEAYPETGRMHQIRKHFAHIFHPIIGDRAHGCNKQNKLFKDRWQMETMLLHASSVHFTHPILEEEVTIEAERSIEFQRTIDLLNLTLSTQ